MIKHKPVRGQSNNHFSTNLIFVSTRQTHFDTVTRKHEYDKQFIFLIHFSGSSTLCSFARPLVKHSTCNLYPYPSPLQFYYVQFCYENFPRLNRFIALYCRGDFIMPGSPPLLLIFGDDSENFSLLEG